MEWAWSSKARSNAFHDKRDERWKNKDAFRKNLINAGISQKLDRFLHRYEGKYAGWKYLFMEVISLAYSLKELGLTYMTYNIT